jgi:cytochrome b561
MDRAHHSTLLQRLLHWLLTVGLLAMPCIGLGMVTANFIRNREGDWA